MNKNEYILRNGFRKHDVRCLWFDQIKENSFGELCSVRRRQICAQMIYLSTVLRILKKILMITSLSSTFTSQGTIKSKTMNGIRFSYSDEG